MHRKIGCYGIIFLFLLTACRAKVPVAPAAGCEKGISEFVISTPPVNGLVNYPESGIITVQVPRGTDRRGLVPRIVVYGGEVSPGSGVAQDFSSEIEYKVTAPDSTTRMYTVSLTESDADEDANSVEISRIFYAYIDALKAGSYRACADYLSPRDLAVLRKGLLSLFPLVGEKSDQSCKLLYEGMLHGLNGSKRLKDLTDQEFYGLYLNVIMNADSNWQVLGIFEKSVFLISEISFEGDTEAVVSDYIYRDGTTLGFGEERCEKIRGAWYIKLREDPERTVATFENLLN